MFSSLLRRSVPTLRSSTRQFSRPNVLLRHNAPLRRALPLGMGLSLGFATGYFALSEVGIVNSPNLLNVQDAADVVWHHWEHAVLTKKETKGMLKVIKKIAPKRDIFKNIQWVTPLFKSKCNVAKETMSRDQFIRWVHYYSDANYTPEQWEVWMRAFDLDSTGMISLNEFISVYVLVQTMESKKIKKRDVFKWAKANFKSMDIDSSGYLDFDEVVVWVEFLIRAGYVSNKTGDTFLSADELADITLRKYDANFDGKISFDEFRDMFTDLLQGRFAEVSLPSDVIVPGERL